MAISGTDFELPLETHNIFLRGYVVRDTKPIQGAFDSEQEEIDVIDPSDWTLVFDCETTVDEAQSLRFGAYQLLKDGILRQHGVFHADDINAADLAVLEGVANMRGLRLRSVRDFVDYVLFDRIYLLGGTVVGFNLPFDISRLALEHGFARKTMRGGFSFKLSRNTDWPRIRVKHISAKMAFIRYGAPPKKRTPAGQTKRGLKVPVRRGSFVDVRTLSSALLSESFSLERLAKTLKVATPKGEAEKHGAPLTPAYVEYCLTDVQATWECFRELTGRLASYQLETIQPKTLYSEASLGKAYLRAMNVKSWRQLQPDFSNELIGQIVSTYFGGRAEVHIRRKKTQVLYCDFLSMYPTVCTLMGLWRFVIAKGLKWQDATVETQDFLNSVQAVDLLNRESWRNLTTLVQLRPNADIFPVRARYDGAESSNIGVNKLTSEKPLWFTLADVITSKILNGDKPPIIDRAIRFDPLERQLELRPVKIAGKADYLVDPNGDEDFYGRVIDLRQTVKDERDRANGADKDRLDAEQLALKILANATSYGIFIEMIVEDLEKSEVLTAYGAEGRGFPIVAKKYEKPGAFFHPLLATLITGAARLMLALAERRTLDAGLDWVFCDTDSLAIARPHDMRDDDKFIRRARSVCADFANLNPYEKPGSILQVEDVNFAPGRKGDWTAILPLQCFAVSAKRYCLFNDGADGAPVIRKASAHGLGHLLPPYEDPDKEKAAKRIREIKVDLWHEDLWTRIVMAAERADGGLALDLESDDRLTAPAASRYAATTPALLDWFKVVNDKRPYEQQVRPFNFLLSFQAQKMDRLASQYYDAAEWTEKHKRPPAPAAPFDRDASIAAGKAFDRQLKDFKVPLHWLQSYAEALAKYHRQPESKFWARDGNSATFSGKLERRHIEVGVPVAIGKEFDNWREQLYIGGDDEEQILGLTPAARAKLVGNIQLGRKRFSVRKICRLAKVTDRTLASAASGRDLVSDAILVRISEAVLRLMSGYDRLADEEFELIKWVEECISEEGPYSFARRIGIDGSNLMSAMFGKRGFSAVTLKILAESKSKNSPTI